MTYEEFKERITEDVKSIVAETMGPTMEVTIKETDHDGYPTEKLFIRPKGIENARNAFGYCSAVELRNVYYAYLKRPVWAEIIRSVKKTISDMKKLPVTDGLEFIRSFDTAKDHLLLCPVPMENRDEAERVICVMMDDIPMSVYFELSHDPNGHTIGWVPKTILKLWKVSEEEVINAAMENQMKADKPVLIPTHEIFSTIIDPENEAMFIATNDKQRYGAVVMGYPGVLDSVCEKLGEDVFIFPSSVHEVALVKESRLKYRDLDEHDGFIRFVNRHYNDEQDILSDKVYHYERATKTFESARSWYKRVFGLVL